MVHEKVDRVQETEGHLPEKADYMSDDVNEENRREEGEE